MVIAIDFDGTITRENLFPKIGELRKNAIEVIQKLQKYGHKCFLWTCREGIYLEDAKNFLESNGLFLDGYNVSPYDNVNYGRKAIADLYIDDCNVLMKKSGVDWKKIEYSILCEPRLKLDEIEILRSNFRQHMGAFCKKNFENKKYGVHFHFNKLSVNKIGCIKSIKKSIANKFTAEEHFEAAENIGELFRFSEVYEISLKKTKKGRCESHYLCISKIHDDVYAFMNVITWGKNDGYIDLYLSKEAE